MCSVFRYNFSKIISIQRKKLSSICFNIKKILYVILYLLPDSRQIFQIPTSASDFNVIISGTIAHLFCFNINKF